MSGRFQVEIWYLKVIGDLDKIPEAVEYYAGVIKDGEQHLIPKGNLERLMAGQAGLLYFYETAYDDATKIEKWLDEHIDYRKALRYKWLQSADGKAQYGELKATDLKQYVEADEEIRYLSENRFYIGAAKKSLSTLCERLKERGIYLSMIAKLRAAGQQEIMIDAGQASAEMD